LAETGIDHVLRRYRDFCRCCVMVADIAENDAQTTAAEIESAGFTAAAIQADISARSRLATRWEPLARG
jgi:hypothetical protein